MTQIKNILLVGRSGSGKSALANVLSGTEKFNETASSVAGTREVHAEEFELEVVLGGNDNLKIKFRVVDTIGIGDTSLKPKQVLTELSKVSEILKDGVYQVFFVTGGRFTEEEIEAYNLLKEVIFDSQIVKYTTIVRTKFIDFDQDEACKEERDKLSGENPKLAELIQLCNGLIYVDNPSKRYSDASETREKSRKRIILHLMSECGNYLPISLEKLNDRIKGYKTREEILQEKLNYWKKKYESSCSIS